MNLAPNATVYTRLAIRPSARGGFVMSRRNPMDAGIHSGVSVAAGGDDQGQEQGLKAVHRGVLSEKVGRLAMGHTFSGRGGLAKRNP